MAEQEFPGNSNKGRMRAQQEAEKDTDNPNFRVKHVVDHPVSHIEEKHKFKWTDLFYKDDKKSFKEFVLKDLVIPNAQRATGAVLHGIVSKLFGPGIGGYNGTYSYGGSGWGYNWSNKPYSVSTNFGFMKEPMSSQVDANKAPSTDLSSYILTTREDAEKVLEGLDAYLEAYDVVPVSAFFDLIGIKAPYSYYDFGWTKLNSSRIIPKEHGWALILPKPVRIK